MSEAQNTVILTDYSEMTAYVSVFYEHSHGLKYQANGFVKCEGFTYQFDDDDLIILCDEQHEDYEIVNDFEEKLDTAPTDDSKMARSMCGWIRYPDGNDVLARVNFSTRNMSMSVAVASNSRENNQHAINAILSTHMPVNIQKDQVGVNFWVCTPQGPNNTTRFLTVPHWNEVEINYNDFVKNAYLGSMERLKNPASGRIMVWHGPPGTGKTWAIRAMMDLLRETFEFHYIVDPEVFFNAEPAYMLQVLMGGNRYGDDKKKRLFILEDTGELLRADAKDRTGQGLSRLLNFTDGLIGQGLEIYVLITTNEPIKEIHPAVIRHGRCLSVIEFNKLTATEANHWLFEHESNHRVHEETPVSELYAIIGDYNYENEKKPVPIGQYV